MTLAVKDISLLQACSKAIFCIYAALCGLASASSEFPVNFRHAKISLEWLKLETSDFVHWLAMWGISFQIDK